MGDPEDHKGPSGANFGRLLQPERGFPSWKAFRGISSRVAGGRCPSNGRRRELLASVSPSRGVPRKMREATGVSSPYQNGWDKAPPGFRRFAITPLRRDFPVACLGDGKKAGD